MRKFLLFLTGLFLFCHFMQAKQIDSRTAQTVAQTFLQGQTTLRNTVPNLNLVYTSKEQSALRSGQTPDNYYYVFNVGNDGGYIIIAADDVNVPVIGYSTKGSYDPQNLPENFKEWMKTVEMGTKQAIEQGAKPSDEIQTRWQNYRAGKIPASTRNGEVQPLVKTLWNQGSPYNLKIPIIDPANGRRVITGCVATAMAQIMKYHNFPASGFKPTKAYTTRTRGIRVNSVNLPEYTYDWGNMTNSYGTHSTQQQKDAVGLLMYHCGAAVEMDYTSGASGAYSYSVYESLTQNFNYDPGIEMVYRSRYSDSEWINLLKEELSQNRPIYYDGRTDNSGHAFVCDGYRSNDEFHFNWGWSGSLNGYYNVNATLGYTKSQSAIIKIKPSNAAPNYKIVLSNGISNGGITSAKAGQSLSIRVSLRNKGNVEFNGYYSVALVDKNNEIKYLVANTDKSPTVQPGTAFSTFMNCLIPVDAISGTYYLKIVIKGSSTDEWQPVNEGTEPHSIEMKIKGVPAYTITLPNGIFTSYVTQRLPGDTFEAVAYISDDKKPNELEGKMCLALTDQNDNIKYILSEDSYWRTIFYTFYCKIPNNALPGNYKLRFMVKIGDETEWSPIDNVWDGYEPYIDFTVQSKPAFSLALWMTLRTWSGNTSAGAGETFRTNVGFFNTGTADFIGYYSVGLTDMNDNVRYVLNDDYANRLIKRNARENYVGSHREYVTSTVPANAIPGKYKLRVIYKESGTSVWKVLKEGVEGNYIDFTVTGSNLRNAFDASSGKTSLSVYPNPVTDILHIKAESNIEKLSVINMAGQTVWAETGNGNTATIAVQHLPSGMYIVTVKTEHETITHKIRKQ